MYLASMVLKHHENQGQPAEDLPIVEWACRELLYQAQEQLHGVLRNFPNRAAGRLMRLLIFPRGLTYFAPADRLGRRVADLVLNNTATRARLCRLRLPHRRARQPARCAAAGARAGARRPSRSRSKLRVEGVKTGRVTALDLPGQIEQARALGILTDAEAQLLADYDRHVMDIINVDDFAPESWELGRHLRARSLPKETDMLSTRAACCACRSSLPRRKPTVRHAACSCRPTVPSSMTDAPMYLAFFGLAEKPFAITPDPRYLYLSARHADALAHLVYGINEAGGFIQLTGEVGTGKTTTIRSLLARAPKNAEIALILNPRLSPRRVPAGAVRGARHGRGRQRRRQHQGAGRPAQPLPAAGARAGTARRADRR